jgi:hypothetical protein
MTLMLTESYLIPRLHSRRLQECELTLLGQSGFDSHPCSTCMLVLASAR